MSRQDEGSVRIMPYTTDYYAEFYDLWNGSFWPPQWKDIGIYWDVIQSLIASRKDSSENGPINVVDIGCGTGRVLKDLLARSRDSATPLSNVKIYGVDPSETMIRRGKAYLHAHPGLQTVAPVEWVSASGEDFTAVAPQLQGTADLVAWTGGGFSHLVTEEKQVQFLRQLAAALRSHSATAVGIILVLHQSIPSHATDPAASAVFEVPWSAPSADRPHLTYYKSKNDVVWSGPVRHDRWTITVRDPTTAHHVHSERIEHTLLNLDEDNWPALVRRAGLRISRAHDVAGMGVFYHVQKIT